MSGQDERNRALWLATRAGKMEPYCPLGTTRCIPQAKFHQKPYNKSFIDQVCSVKMAGYWPRSFFASLWASTSSRSINTQKKNLANIQPSWPHTWSITHTYSACESKSPAVSKIERYAQSLSHWVCLGDGCSRLWAPGWAQFRNHHSHGWRQFWRFTNIRRM